MLINCHLASGGSKDQQRTMQLVKIFENAFQSNLRNRGMTVENHNHVFLMGDLNFRISNLSRAQILEQIRKNDMATLLDQDTLTLARFNYKKGVQMLAKKA